MTELAQGLLRFVKALRLALTRAKLLRFCGSGKKAGVCRRAGCHCRSRMFGDSCFIAKACHVSSN
jgi:hypothetical protein